MMTIKIISIILQAIISILAGLAIGACIGLNKKYQHIIDILCEENTQSTKVINHLKAVIANSEKIIVNNGEIVNSNREIIASNTESLINIENNLNFIKSNMVRRKNPIKDDK